MTREATAPVLVTATVTPRVQLAAGDPSARLREYLDVFGRLLETPQVSGIVFAENSGSDLFPFAEAARRAGREEVVELLGVPSDDYRPEDGRAYGEALLMRHALDASRLIGGRDLFWKLTGRYRVRNLGLLIARAPADVDLNVNLRRYPQRWCDTYLFAATRAGWAAVERFLPRLRVEGPAEPVMYDIVRELMAEGSVRITPRLRREPLVEGVRGFDAARYGEGKQLWKYRARVAGRGVMPWLWI